MKSAIVRPNVRSDDLTLAKPTENPFFAALTVTALNLAVIILNTILEFRINAALLSVDVAWHRQQGVC